MQNIKKNIVSIAAAIILCLMFVILFASAWNDSATMDELAHIPSGYSYLSQKDYRLNPEHPPLIKDLSALPLMFLGLKFPTNVTAWTEYLNGQWDMGRIFLYESGNNADKIIHYSRLPIMLLAILFGWMFFKWIRGIYGDKTALLALFLYAFSPTIIAHSRYVTTDLGAAFGFFIGIATFVKYLQNPSRKNLIIAGIAFGIAQLLKFSLVLLVPQFIMMIIIWAWTNPSTSFGAGRTPEIGFFKLCTKFIGRTILIGLISLIIIWPVYQFHVWDYPVARQIQDTTATIGSFGIKPLSNLVIWMADKPVLRPLGQYLLGVLMVMQRATGGNTAYFLGNVSNTGSRIYFPLLYVLKESLAFHFLTIIALVFTLKKIFQKDYLANNKINALKNWLRENFAMFSGLLFAAFYMFMSIKGNLNIGVRHILPILPFMYFFAAVQIAKWTDNKPTEQPQNFAQHVKFIYESYIKPFAKYFVVAVLVLWMLISTLSAFPNYLSYYNILGGGTNNGYNIAVDSNYDWGQDLRRLKTFVDKNNIQNIGIDYFGGGNLPYYFGDKFTPWQSAKGAPTKEAGQPQWLAISVGFLKTSQDSYSWLSEKKPVAKAGKSIFIYKF